MWTLFLSFRTGSIYNSVRSHCLCRLYVLEYILFTQQRCTHESRTRPTRPYHRTCTTIDFLPTLVSSESRGPEIRVDGYVCETAKHQSSLFVRVRPVLRSESWQESVYSHSMKSVSEYTLTHFLLSALAGTQRAKFAFLAYFFCSAPKSCFSRPFHLSSVSSRLPSFSGAQSA